MNIYDRIKDCAKQKGLPFISFMQSLGINYGSWKSAKHIGLSPRIDEVYKIAQALNVSLEYLLTGQDSNKLSALLNDMQAVIDKYR